MADDPSDTTEVLPGSRVTLAPYIGEWDAVTTVRPHLADAEATLALHGPFRSGVTVEGELGEGGSAVVELARQLSLDRQVALKRLRDDLLTPQARLQLLREAWLTSRIDHPNVVPVHDLIWDDQGRPQILLKRIEGACWHDLIDTPEAVRQRFRTDPTEWHVRVLMGVCSALEAAHDVGVLHRDVKPANVMIGRFGEAYLVDWGIATALHDGLGEHLPRQDTTAVLAGTPAYMAPELATLDARLDVRTDVYLLGASLYHLLTGHPPHGTDRLEAVLERALRSAPPPVPGADPELMALALRAMDPDPEERPRNASAFHARLRDFLAHRGSRALAREAASQLRALQATFSDPDSQDVQRLFGAARFGYRRALEAWPDNEQARAELDETVAAMVRHELRAGRVSSALTHAAELPAPPPDIAEALIAAAADQAEQAERLGRLEALARSVDPRRGGLPRALALSGMMLLWWGLPTLRDALGIPISYANTYLQSGAFLAASLVVAWAWRSTWRSSAVSRGLIATLVFAMAAQPMLDVACELAGLPFETARSLHSYMGFVVVGTLACTIDARFLAAALAYAATLLVSARDPGSTPYAMDVANAALVAVAIWIAHADDERSARPW